MTRNTTLSNNVNNSNSNNNDASMHHAKSVMHSTNKLPEIGLSTKQSMFMTRVERFVHSNISKVDRATLADIYHVSEYVGEITAHMQQTERETQPDPSYMKRQPEISENIRAVLIDWLISVHAKFKLLPETLFITVNLVDRFLSVAEISKDKIQLCGVAALLIATKYEEIYPPMIKDFIFVSNKAFTREHVLQMEREMIYALEFQIQETSAYRFLERYWKIAKGDHVLFYLS